MLSGTWVVKCVTGFSVTYLCDRIINESCRYLCTSSNRRRWAAFITKLREACCHMKFEPRPRRALGITKGKIHSRANLCWNDGSRQCQSPLLLHGGCEDDGTRSLCAKKKKRKKKDLFHSMVTEHHTVVCSRYYHWWLSPVQCHVHCISVFLPKLYFLLNKFLSDGFQVLNVLTHAPLENVCKCGFWCNWICHTSYWRPGSRRA